MTTLDHGLTLPSEFAIRVGIEAAHELDAESGLAMFLRVLELDEDDVDDMGVAAAVLFIALCEWVPVDAARTLELAREVAGDEDDDG